MDFWCFPPPLLLVTDNSCEEQDSYFKWSFSGFYRLIRFCLQIRALAVVWSTDKRNYWFLICKMDKLLALLWAAKWAALILYCKLEVNGFHPAAVWFWMYSACSLPCMSVLFLPVQKQSFFQKVRTLIGFEHETHRLELVCVQQLGHYAQDYMIRVAFMVGVCRFLYKACVSWELLGPPEFAVPTSLRFLPSLNFSL